MCHASLPTHYQAQTQLPHLLRNTNLERWTHNCHVFEQIPSRVLLTMQLPKGVCQGRGSRGMATRDHEWERTALSLWQQYLSVLVETTQLKPFQTQRMDKYKPPKGTISHYRQTHVAEFFFCSALRIPGALLPSSEVIPAFL